MGQAFSSVVALIGLFASTYIVYLQSIGKLDQHTMITLLLAAFAITTGIYLGNTYSQNNNKAKKITGALQTSAKSGILEVPLTKKQIISHDTYLFTFELPDPLGSLGLEIGQHVTIIAKLPTQDHPEGEDVKRSYTPVSRIDHRGSFDLLVKIYRKNTHPKFPEGGKVTQYLESLEIGDKIRISGPKGQLEYKGNGHVHRIIKDKKIKNKFSHLGLIAGGSGITPMFQIMKHIFDDKNDQTIVHLLFANKSEQDILLKPEIESIASDKRFKIYYILDVVPDKNIWKGFEGFVTKEMLMQTMPNPGQTTLICQCGPPLMNKLVLDSLKQIGHSEENIHKF